jgi:hypothetical protein
VIAILVMYARRGHTSGNKNQAYERPPPKIAEAVGHVEADLGSISSAGRALESHLVDTNDMADMEGGAMLAGARTGAKQMVGSLRMLQADLSRAPPTYQTALGLYQQLSGSDARLLGASGYLDEAAADMKKDGRHPYVQQGGHKVSQLAASMRNLLRSTHYLGSALNLE